MDIGVLTVPLGDRSLDDTLSYLADLGVGAVELGCGGFPGDDHLPREEYLGDEGRREDLEALLEAYDLRVSALATHNNPLHPSEERAQQADTELREAVTLASQLGVEAVTCFSGLPGGGPDEEVPNWITAPWPSEHAAAQDYQWEVADRVPGARSVVRSVASRRSLLFCGSALTSSHD